MNIKLPLFKERTKPFSSLKDFSRNKLESRDDFIDICGLTSSGKSSITFKKIDEIRNHPKATTTRISGLHQDTFDYFVEKYGGQFQAIEFWKCPKVHDLSKLELLTKVEFISYFWNQKATKLWDMSKSRYLKGLDLDDLDKITDLSELEMLQNLEELDISSGMWGKLSLDSLAPIAACTKLKYLRFIGHISFADGDVSPLAKLQNLEHFNFPSNMFLTEQVAWLKARLPESVEGRFFRAVSYPASAEGTVMVIGKRKPWSLDTVKDRKRIEKYETQFQELVENYRCNPDDPAPQITTASKRSKK